MFARILNLLALLPVLLHCMLGSCWHQLSCCGTAPLVPAMVCGADSKSAEEHHDHAHSPCPEGRTELHESCPCPTDSCPFTPCEEEACVLAVAPLGMGPQSVELTSPLPTLEVIVVVSPLILPGCRSPLDLIQYSGIKSSAERRALSQIWLV